VNLQIEWWVFGLSLAVPLYTFLGYPLILKALALVIRRPLRLEEPAEWPSISYMIPAYNEEASIAAALEGILASDYPKDRVQIMVGSDCSSDRTDEIVRGYADRGVELLRMPERSGKTATENAMRAMRRGEIIVHVDASVRIEPSGTKRLVMAFGDPEVGVASSRDISTAGAGERSDTGESSYVGYEMWLRRLETQVYGITGVSGSFFANRRELHTTLVPVALSRDFAAAMVGRRQGLRAVSVDNAICYVPRNPSLRREYRRKVRTMARGLETLWYHRDLLNPFRYGLFAWMLVSHKLVRWLVPWALVTAGVSLAVAAFGSSLAGEFLYALLLALAAAWLGWIWPEGRRRPKVLGLPAYVVSGVAAGLHAWTKALSGELNPIWEPTRR
jgi:cellulose synthase/poly-beta-1,6-N-acetylglucosamine synthase-like glycosyltransferase